MNIIKRCSNLFSTGHYSRRCQNAAKLIVEGKPRCASCGLDLMRLRVAQVGTPAGNLNKWPLIVSSISHPVPAKIAKEAARLGIAIESKPSCCPECRQKWSKNLWNPSCESCKEMVRENLAKKA